MSNSQNPDPNTDKPAGKPNDKPTGSGLKINFAEIPDPETQTAVKQLLQERDVVKAELNKVNDTLKAINDRELQRAYEKNRAAKMGKLREIDPRLADKHKDESSLEKIDLLIDTAQSFKSNFADYQKDDSNNNDKPKIMGYIDPNTGKVV